MNNRRLVIYVKEYEIHTDEELLSLDGFSSSDFQNILHLFDKHKLRGEILHIEDYSKSDIEITVLLALTVNKNEFVYKNEKADLTFAYAIPLDRDLFLREFTIQNLTLCINNKQIVLLPNNSLYLYEKVNGAGFNLICNSEKKTIKRNRNTIVNEIPFSDAFFSFWKEYDYTRFGENQTEEFQEFFRYVYSNPEFKLYEYICEGVIVGYNVCYYSNSQKVIYDILFPWKKHNSAFRIGIYSIIVNLQHALNIGWGYSICYGIFSYKNAILDKLEE